MDDNCEKWVESMVWLVGVVNNEVDVASGWNLWV